MDLLQDIEKSFNEQIIHSNDLLQLDLIRVSFIGKKGLLTKAMSQITSLSASEKKKFGQTANKLRNYIVTSLEDKKNYLSHLELKRAIDSENIDITLPVHQYSRGMIHPISKVIADIENIFTIMGFECTYGPEIEDNWHNFTALNIEDLHPARQMQDTFYTADNNLLRTHTSPVQVRYMMSNNPPIKIISTGRVYRADYDTTHTPMFHQVEGLCIDSDTSLSHLKWVLEEFLRLFFGKNVPIRMRSSYFPFTEPSFEVDILCDRSDKNIIKLGTGDDWLEILGCGMVHEKVLKNVNIDANKYQGFAFGIGIERLLMLKYCIADIRTLFESNINWLHHYGF